MKKNEYEFRPNPDELLLKAQREIKGKLTIFLGGMAGVGKTYAMLSAAHDKLIDRLDVIVGVVVTHKRNETEALVKGLPIIPLKKIKYRNKLLEEMDIDAILERKPQLVLVDELAHTNVDGSRHVRRYQDVQELIDAGIDVFTTLNIQHIESLNDIVAKITGVIVRETVPDSIFQNADSIKLIDITPDELVKRLNEGKVYIPQQAKHALKNFFREGNINALRELAMRFAAKRVDEEIADYMRNNRIEGPWPASGKVLVCVTSSPFAAQLIRAAKRLAEGFKAELIAVHVISQKKTTFASEKEEDRLQKNLKLVEDLGGKTTTLIGYDRAKEIVEFARRNNVNTIVMGKPIISRLQNLFKETIVDKAQRYCGDINFYVIQEKAKNNNNNKTLSKKRLNKNKLGKDIIFCLFFVGTSLSLGILIKNSTDIFNLGILYFLGTIFVAFGNNRWFIYKAIFFGVFVYSIFFTSHIKGFNNIIVSVIAFILIYLVGERTERLKDEAYAARRREKSTRYLFEFSRDIASLFDVKVIAQRLAAQCGDTLSRKTFVLIPKENTKLKVIGYWDKDETKKANYIKIDEQEYAVAVWAYQHGQKVGRTTETLPMSKCLHIPMISGEKRIGVLSIDVSEEKINSEEQRQIESWARLATIAIERVQLTEQSTQIEFDTNINELRIALLNSLSYELSKPLADVTATITKIIENKIADGVEDLNANLSIVKRSSKRMEHIVSNISETARLESKTVKLNKEYVFIKGIFEKVKKKLEEELTEYKFNLHIDKKVNKIIVDPALMEQVLTNIIDNAIQYSKKDSKIEIFVTKEKEKIKIKISDRGWGISVSDKNQVFEKFYRAKTPYQVAGSGLGLAICKTIIEAHNGSLTIESRTKGGTSVIIILPQISFS